MEVFKAINTYLDQGKKSAVATVVSKAGAAPREIGAKMVIGADGRFFGTIGGGCVDAEVWQHARMVMQTERPMLLRYAMNGAVAEEDGMICGGIVEILVEPVLPRHMSVWHDVEELTKQGSRGVLLTRYASGVFLKSVLREDSVCTGETIDIATEGLERHFNGRTLTIEDDVLIEPLLRPEVLYVFGAGHISQFVSKIAFLVDFRVVIVDDRSSFANRERFPEAEEIVIDDFSEVVDKLSFTGAEYAVVVTRGHKHDATILEKLLLKPTKYVGMIGSRRKNKLIFDHLMTKGVTSEEIARVHAPVGIDLGSETPQEIALSIAAQLVQVRRNCGDQRGRNSSPSRLSLSI